MKRSFLSVALVLVSLVVSSVAYAAYSGFAGNGRGGPVASQPTCNDTNRGRVWDLYPTPNDGTAADIPQICYRTGTSGTGTYTWHTITSS